MKNYIFLFLLTLTQSVLLAQVKPFNDDCTNALPVRFNTLYEQKNVFPNLDSIYTCYGQKQSLRGVWYEVVGNDSIIVIKPGSANLNVIIVEGDCDSLFCTKNSFYSGNFSHYIKKGIIYKVLLFNDGNKIDYSVTFDIFPIDPASSCESAPLLSCENEIVIESQGLIKNSTTLCGNNNELSKYAWIKIIGNGEIQKLSYSTTTQPIAFYTFVYESPCKDSMKCILNNYSSDVLSLATELGKEYLVQIQLSSDFNIPFVVQHKCESIKTQFTCSGAKELSCGGQYNNQKMTDEYIIVTNQDKKKEYGLWYKLPKTKGKQVQLNFNGPSFGILNGDLYRANSNDCDNLSLAYTNSVVISNDEFDIDIVDEEQYYFYLYGYKSDPFSLRVDCIDITYKNNSCENSQELDICDDSITVKNSFLFDKTLNQKIKDYNNSGKWFSFIGGDKPIEISSNFIGNIPLTIFEGDCNTLISPVSSYFYSNEQSYILNVVKNKTYYLRIGYDVSSDFNLPYKIFFKCYEGDLTGLRCSDATEVSCGQIIPVNTSAVINDPLIKSDCQQIFLHNWFKIIGDGTIKTIQGTNLVRAEVYKSDNCIDLECVAIPYGSSYVTFPTELGVTYFIAVNGRESGNLEILCQNDSLNDSCINPLDVSCIDGSVPIDFRQTYQIDSFTYKPSSLWFQLNGNDKLISIKTKLGSPMRISSQCTNLSSDIPYLSSANIFLESNKNVLVEVIPSVYSIFDTLVILCQDNTISNDKCDNSKEIKCGDEFTLNLSIAPTAKKVTNNVVEYLPYKEAWYRFEGTGESWVIKVNNGVGYGYEVFSNNCDDSPIFNGFVFDQLGAFVINSEINKTYFVRLTFYGLLDYNPTFSVECNQSISNYNCINATTLGCESSAIIEPKDLSQTQILVKDIGILKNVSWFKLESDTNSIVSIDNSASILYESKYGCDSLKQVKLLTIGLPNFIERKMGYSYYIAIGNFNYFALETNINITHQCVPDVDDFENYGCDNRKLLECGKFNDVTNGISLPSTFNNCTPSNYGTWYEVTGNGEYFQFSLTGDVNYFNNVNFIIGEGANCDSVQCTCILPVTYSGIVGFQSKIGQKYFIKLSWNNIYSNSIKGFKFSCFEDVDNHTCSEAVPVLCNNNIYGIISNSIIADSLEVCQTLNKGNYYLFEGDGENITFLFSDISNDNLNYQIIENSCTDGRCLFTGQVSDRFTSERNQFTIDTKKGTNYIIKISSNVDCSFSFKTSCFETHENVTCQNSDLIQCDASIRLNLQSPLGIIVGTGCGNSANQIQHWFQLPKNKKWFKINFDSLNLNQGLSINYYKGSCNLLECIQTWDFTSETNAVYGNNDNDYYMMITRSYYNINLDSIDFKISCEDSKSNDLCTQAIELKCETRDTSSTFLTTYTPLGQFCSLTGPADQWYKLIGNDSLAKISLKNLKGGGELYLYSNKECDNIGCSSYPVYLNNNENVYTFFAKKDTTYYLRLLSLNNANIYEFDIQYSCLKQLPNDNCNGSTIVNTISETLTIPFYNATQDDFDFNICGQGSVTVKDGLWYTFDGNDSLVIFSVPFNSNAYIKYMLFEGSCGDLTCISNDIIYSSRDLNIAAKKDKKYILVFYTNDNYNQDLSLSVISKSLDSNWNCENSLPMLCQDTIVMNKNNLLASSSQCNGTFGHSVWHHLIDNDSKLYKITSIDLQSNISISAKETCDDPCLSYLDLPSSPGSFIQYYIPRNKKYIIESKTLINNETAKFEIECVEEHYYNLLPENAIQLTCDRKIINTSKAGFLFDYPIANFRAPLLFYSFTGNDSLIILKTSFDFPNRFFVADESYNILSELTQGVSFQTVKNKKYYLFFNFANFENVDHFIELQGLCNPIGTIEILVKNNINVTPNPFSDFSEVIFEKDIDRLGQLLIFDYLGRQISSIDISKHDGEKTIQLQEISDVPPGVYFIEYKTQDSYGKTRFIKLK